MEPKSTHTGLPRKTKIQRKNFWSSLIARKSQIDCGERRPQRMAINTPTKPRGAIHTAPRVRVHPRAKPTAAAPGRAPPRPPTQVGLACARIVAQRRRRCTFGVMHRHRILTTGASSPTGTGAEGSPAPCRAGQCARSTRRARVCWPCFACSPFQGQRTASHSPICLGAPRRAPWTQT